MGYRLPRAAAIHDMSGFGRCSLTVIIPVLSSMGIQVCPIPTAVLSTHSGGFGSFTFSDLTEIILPYAEHWRSLELEFDYIYSGFLGSDKQIDIVAAIADTFTSKGNPIVVVDPVMGDNGRLYKTYTSEMQIKMKQLIRKANIITPNPTEMYYLLDEPFSEGPVDCKHMKALLKRLSDMGPEKVVVTGVLGEDGWCNICYDSITDEYWRVKFKRIPVNYPGTGDIFTSVLIGGMSMGDSLPEAIARATGFLSLAVGFTYEHKTPEREGVMLEVLLARLNEKPEGFTYEVLK
ncbi:MAG: pyridoxamine kinase [Bacillota bacterium]